MKIENNSVLLYSSQTNLVVDKLDKDGVCFNKKEFVVRKYEEVAPIFVAAYSWFVNEAQNYVKGPPEAEYPYWAFADINNVESHADSTILKLNVPLTEAIYFDMQDWYKVLRLSYIGETAQDEAKFKKMLEAYGVKNESDVILTNFYPQLKREVQESWKRLFKHHENIKRGRNDGDINIQAALWQIKKEWIHTL